jgi:hypothetical protein
VVEGRDAAKVDVLSIVLPQVEAVARPGPDEEAHAILGWLVTYGVLLHRSLDRVTRSRLAGVLRRWLPAASPSPAPAGMPIHESATNPLLVGAREVRHAIELVSV